MPNDSSASSPDLKAALRRWIAIGAFLLILCYALTAVLRARGAASAGRTVALIYGLVAAGDYTALARDHLATASAIATFREAERVHGHLTDWKQVSADTHLLGRPTQTEVMVTRNGKDYVDVLALGDSVHLHIVMELEVTDWKEGRYDRAIRMIAKPPDPKRP
jgi:hypothetical protein